MTRRRLLIMGSIIAPLLLFLAILPALPGKILDDVPFSPAFLDREGDLLQVFLASDEKIRMYAPAGSFPPKRSSGFIWVPMAVMGVRFPF